jgi:hypothetical protein
MSNDKIAKLIGRINQLRAISRSTHSKAEAETCLQLVAKLIAEHQLSEATIEAESGKTDEEMFTDQESDWNVVYESGRSTPWKAKLVTGLARLNGVYCLQFHGIRNATSHRQGSRYRVFGRKSDIEITKYMFDYLVNLISSLAQDYVVGGKKRGVNPERESWALGCVDGFLAKMTAEKAAVMRNSTSSAMVLVGNRQEEAKKALTASDPKLKIGAGQASKAQIHDTYGSGYRKGQTLTVNPGMSGGGNREPNKLGK